MYRIVDNYGTNQTAWSWTEALSWLWASAPTAMILNRFTGRVIALRSIA